MDGIDSDRALVVGRDFIGLGILGADRDVLVVRAWSDEPGGPTAGLADAAIPVAALEACPASADPARTGVALVAFDATFSPYRFGLHDYDPFESLAASIERAAAGGKSLSLALWTAMEADLFRFAFDRGFTDALDGERGSPDWIRFARLNDLYRASVRAIAPFGTVPSGWGAWLRHDGAGAASRASRPAAALAKALTRPASSIGKALCRGTTGGLRAWSGDPGLKLPPPEPILEARYHTE